MINIEKLGLFYLGRRLDPNTRARLDVPLLYDASDLVTHGVIVGMTGSGKTGLGIALMEEAAIDGVPVIAIDPKGDLGNLLLTFPGLSGDEFAPWVNPDDARRAGQTMEAFGASEAARWKAGLAEWGQDGARIERLRGAAEFTFYTPGSTTGRSISIVKSFAAPSPAVVADAELLSDRVTTAATSVLTLAGVDADPMRSREHILVSSLFTEAWRQGRDLDLAALIGQVQAPPMTKIGVLDLESFFPARERFALSMQLNQLLAAPGFAVWLQGEPLDIDRLLFGPSGKPRVSVISIAHLDDHERMFFVSLLLNELVAWMRGQRGTSSLRALMYFDEIYGFLPPVANPPSKRPLMTLLKQARAVGLGVTVATQNPVDLDYKALANAGTWMLGRLQTDRDKARVLDGLEGAASGSGASFDRARLDALLSASAKRVFLLHNVHEAEPQLFETRWAMSYLRGPLGREEIRRMAQVQVAQVQVPQVHQVPQVPSGAVHQVRQVTQVTQVRGTSQQAGDVGAPAAPEALEAPAAPHLTAPVAPVAPEAPAVRPLLDPSIRQFFAPGSGSRLVPLLLGAARISYADAKLGLDEYRDVTLVTPISDAAVPVDWDKAEPAEFTTGDLRPAPTSPGAVYAPVPAAASRSKSYAAWEKDFVRWAAQSQSVELFKSARTKIVSAPAESERDFRIRLQTEGREARDVALAKVRARYATKLTALDDRLRRADHTVQVQSEQSSGAKMQAAVSIGATIFGALLGRKAMSASTLGRATTAARGMGRIGRESEDVSRAQANADAIRQQRDDLNIALQADLQTVSADWDVSQDTLDRTLVKPRRGGVAVQIVALVWVPEEA